MTWNVSTDKAPKLVEQAAQTDIAPPAFLQSTCSKPQPNSTHINQAAFDTPSEPCRKLAPGSQQLQSCSQHAQQAGRGCNSKDPAGRANKDLTEAQPCTVQVVQPPAMSAMTTAAEGSTQPVLAQAARSKHHASLTGSTDTDMQLGSIPSTAAVTAKACIPPAHNKQASLPAAASQQTTSANDLESPADADAMPSVHAATTTTTGTTFSTAETNALQQAGMDDASALELDPEDSLICPAAAYQAASCSPLQSSLKRDCYDGAAELQASSPFLVKRQKACVYPATCSALTVSAVLTQDLVACPSKHLLAAAAVSTPLHKDPADTAVVQACTQKSVPPPVPHTLASKPVMPAAAAKIVTAAVNSRHVGLHSEPIESGLEKTLPDKPPASGHSTAAVAVPVSLFDSSVITLKRAQPGVVLFGSHSAQQMKQVSTNAKQPAARSVVEIEELPSDFPAASSAEPGQELMQALDFDIDVDTASAKKDTARAGSHGLLPSGNETVQQACCTRALTAVQSQLSPHVDLVFDAAEPADDRQPVPAKSVPTSSGVQWCAVQSRRDQRSCSQCKLVFSMPLCSISSS